MEDDGNHPKATEITEVSLSSFTRWRIAASCAFGFLSWFAPYSPFLVQFLGSRGISNEQVYDSVFPVWTYSEWGWLALLCLASEFFDYRLFLLIGSIANVISIILTLYPSSGENVLIALKLGQAANSLFFTSSMLFIACILRSTQQSNEASNQPREETETIPENALKSGKKMQRNVSVTRAAILVGTVISALLGQLFLEFSWGPLKDLFWITLAATLISVPFIFLAFPSKLRANDPLLVLPTARNDDQQDLMGVNQGERILDGGGGFTARTRLWADWLMANFRRWVEIYREREVLKWSLWSAWVFAIHSIVLLDWQSVIKALGAETNQNSLNGFVQSGSYAMGALASLLPVPLFSLLPSSTARFLVSASPCVAPLILGCLLAAFALAPTFWAKSLAFVAYQSTFEFMTVLSTAQIGQFMPNSRLASVISFNSLLSLSFQALIQLVLQEINQSINVWYLVLAGANLGLGVIFLTLSLVIAPIISKLRHPQE